MAEGANVLPERITAYRAYLDSKVLLGLVDAELPKIALSTQTIKGAGILGELETPTMGYTKALELTLNFRTTTKQMITLLKCVGHDIELRSTEQKYDPSTGKRTFDKKRIVVRGGPSEGTLEKLESEGANSSSVKLALTYLKYVINGETVLEIDKVNYIYSVNGDDALAEVRDALGMT